MQAVARVNYTEVMIEFINRSEALTAEIKECASLEDMNSIRLAEYIRNAVKEYVYDANRVDWIEVANSFM